MDPSSRTRAWPPPVYKTETEEKLSDDAVKQYCRRYRGQ